jgi:hypothetical protein
LRTDWKLFLCLASKAARRKERSEFDETVSLNQTGRPLKSENKKRTCRKQVRLKDTDGDVA